MAETVLRESLSAVQARLEVLLSALQQVTGADTTQGPGIYRHLAATAQELYLAIGAVRSRGDDPRLGGRRRPKLALPVSLCAPQATARLNTDLMGRVLSADPSAARMLAVSSGLLPGVPLALLLMDEDQPRLLKTLARLSRDGALPDELRLRVRSRPTEQSSLSLLLAGLERGDDGAPSSVQWFVMGAPLTLGSGQRGPEPQQLAQKVVSNLLEGYLSLDTQWRILEANEAAALLLGRRRDLLLGEYCGDVVQGLAGSLLDEHLHHALSAQEPCHVEVPFPASGRWAEVHAYPQEGGLGVFLHDITSRKRSEQAHKDSEDRLFLAVEANGLGTWDSGPGLQGLQWSAASHSILGSVPETSLSHDALVDRMEPGDQAPFEQALARAQDPGGDRTLDVTFRYHPPDRTLRWLYLRGRVFFEASLGLHRPVRILGILSDVTDERQAAEALIESERRFHALAEGLPLIVWTTTPAGDCDYLSSQWSLFTGQPDAESLGKGWLECVHPEDWDSTDAAWAVALESGAEFLTEHRIRRVDGIFFWFEARAVPVRGPDRRIRQWLGSSVNIEGRKRTEEALRVGQERERRRAAEIEALMEAVPAAVWISRDPLCQVISGSRVARHILRAPEGSNLSLSGPEDERPTHFRVLQDGRLLEPEDLPMQRAARTGQEVRDFEQTLQFEDGTEVHLFGNATPLLDAQGRPTGAVSAFVDITDRVHAEAQRLRLEAQIQETQRLESLGVLAGGIAHDFNNLLTAILGSISLVKEGLPAHTEGARLLDSAEKSAYRAAELASQMLAYAGRGRFVIQPLCVNDTIRDLRPLLSALLPQGARLGIELGSAVPRISGDANQIRQVVLNLTSNAAEALSEGGGLVTLRTGHLSELPVLAHNYLEETQAYGYVSLTVSDDGQGMDPETLSRICEPFYSTKFTGRGLGMAAVLGIVRGHHGGMALRSSSGEGSEVTVVFPALRDESEAPSAPPTLADAPMAPRAVLVVDGEELIRGVTEAVLESAGYRSVGAGDCAEALSILRARNFEFSAVLLDQSQPGMDAHQALEGIRELCPALPVVVTSDDLPEATLHYLSDLGVSRVLHKPYTPGGLLEALDQATHPPPPALNQG
ncbi:MAG TPA: PAS domain-containing protein [Armatimonadota bacterium]|jgi:PAS domain S-box-containing protein